MLLRFAISNYCSLRELQVLNFSASTLKDRNEGLIECLASPTNSILPVVVIYGANASGKSNYIAAMDMMRNLVLGSHTKFEPDQVLPHHPFALDNASSKTPTRVEVDFVIEGIRYHYGFEVTNTAFESEWLYAIPKSRSRLLFERDGDNFRFGRELKGQNRIIAAMTRSNSLFLSAAAQNKHEQLSRIFSYFKTIRGSIISTTQGTQDMVVSMYLSRNGLDPRVITFLDNIDTGVIGYHVKQNPYSKEILNYQQDMIDSVRRNLNESFIAQPAEMDKKFELAHRGANGESFNFDLDWESTGTLRLLIVLSEVFRALDDGSPIYIDEIDASLHTQACEALLQLFCSPKINRNGAQLIATTHDTNLMRSSVLRRDQVWLMEKGSDGATELFPLSDFQTRSGDNIEKGYLQGRFGAVPSDNPTLGLGSAK